MPWFSHGSMIQKQGFQNSNLFCLGTGVEVVIPYIIITSYYNIIIIIHYYNYYIIITSSYFLHWRGWTRQCWTHKWWSLTSAAWCGAPPVGWGWGRFSHSHRKSCPTLAQKPLKKNKNKIIIIIIYLYI